jgi:hypothetical protein
MCDTGGKCDYESPIGCEWKHGIPFPCPEGLMEKDDYISILSILKEGYKFNDAPDLYGNYMLYKENCIYDIHKDNVKWLEKEEYVADGKITEKGLKKISNQFLNNGRIK